MHSSLAIAMHAQQLAQPPRCARQAARSTAGLRQRAAARPVAPPRRREWRCYAAQVSTWRGQRCYWHRPSSEGPCRLPPLAALIALPTTSACRRSCRSGTWCCLTGLMERWRLAASARWAEPGGRTSCPLQAPLLLVCCVPANAVTPLQLQWLHAVRCGQLQPTCCHSAHSKPAAAGGCSILGQPSPRSYALPSTMRSNPAATHIHHRSGAAS